MGDMYNSVLVKPTLAIDTRTATADGTTVDRADSDAMYQSAVVVVHTGTITDGTHTIQVEESDDDSTWAAVADADLQGTEPAIGSDDDDTVYEIGYMGSKRYVRASISDISGATSGGVYGATVLLGDPRVSPVVRS